MHSIKAISVSHSALPTSGLGMGKRLGGNATGTADPNCPKEYSMPGDIMFDNKTPSKVPIAPSYATKHEC